MAKQKTKKESLNQHQGKHGGIESNDVAYQLIGTFGILDIIESNWENRKINIPDEFKTIGKLFKTNPQWIDIIKTYGIEIDNGIIFYMICKNSILIFQNNEFFYIPTITNRLKNNGKKCSFGFKNDNGGILGSSKNDILFLIKKHSKSHGITFNQEHILEIEHLTLQAIQNYLSNGIESDLIN